MLAFVWRLVARARFCACGVGQKEFNELAYSAIHTKGALQKRLEFSRCLRKVAEVSPATVLEVGTRRGGSLYAWSQIATRDATLVSVDWHPSEDASTSRARLQGCVRPTQDLHCIWGNSHAQETQDQVRDALAGRPVDLMFLDGDHTYEGLAEDFRVFEPLVRSGGMIVFHDIVDNPRHPDYGVARFWQELQSQDLETHAFIDAIDPIPGMGLGVMVKR